MLDAILWFGLHSYHVDDCQNNDPFFGYQGPPPMYQSSLGVLESSGSCQVQLFHKGPRTQIIRCFTMILIVFGP